MGAATVSRDLIPEQLEKILASSLFQNAGRSRALLKFIVQEFLNDRVDQLKEYTVGAGALERDSFDPRTDPIVRAEASRLRGRLERYYATEGQADTVVIVLPKGSYVPQFLDRSLAVALTPAHIPTLDLKASPFPLYARQRHHNSEGTEITAYINGDIPLDPIKFQTQRLAPPASAADTAQNRSGGDPVLSSVEVKSNPDGADITVDEKYMGSTPSTLKLAPGDHKVKLERPGFKSWERTLTVSAGAAATVNPTLDKN